MYLFVGFGTFWYLCLNSSGTATIIEGAVAASQAAAEVPYRYGAVAVIGVVEIDNNVNFAVYLV